MSYEVPEASKTPAAEGETEQRSGISYQLSTTQSPKRRRLLEHRGTHVKGLQPKATA